MRHRDQVVAGVAIDGEHRFGGQEAGGIVDLEGATPALADHQHIAELFAARADFVGVGNHRHRRVRQVRSEFAEGRAQRRDSQHLGLVDDHTGAVVGDSGIEWLERRAENLQVRRRLVERLDDVGCRAGRADLEHQFARAADGQGAQALGTFAHAVGDDELHLVAGDRGPVRGEDQVIVRSRQCHLGRPCRDAPIVAV